MSSLVGMSENMSLRMLGLIIFLRKSWALLLDDGVCNVVTEYRGNSVTSRIDFVR